jgi:hypothetical protein
MSKRRSVDSAIGKAIREEYARQVAMFRSSCSPQWARLENPSFDFSSTTVKEIIDRAEGKVPA